MQGSRAVIVTGASSGIGRAMALAFGRLGDDVVVGYHEDEAGATEACAAVHDAEFVFLSVPFWSWLWGIAGAIMAVPVLLALRAVSQLNRRLRSAKLASTATFG